jgi:hypothetical protein
MDSIEDVNVTSFDVKNCILKNGFRHFYKEIFPNELSYIIDSQLEKEDKRRWYIALAETNTLVTPCLSCGTPTRIGNHLKMPICVWCQGAIDLVEHRPSYGRAFRMIAEVKIELPAQCLDKLDEFQIDTRMKSPKSVKWMYDFLSDLLEYFPEMYDVYSEHIDILMAVNERIKDTRAEVFMSCNPPTQLPCGLSTPTHDECKRACRNVTMKDGTPLPMYVRCMVMSSTIPLHDFVDANCTDCGESWLDYRHACSVHVLRCMKIDRCFRIHKRQYVYVTQRGTYLSMLMGKSIESLKPIGQQVRSMYINDWGVFGIDKGGMLGNYSCQSLNIQFVSGSMVLRNLDTYKITIGVEAFFGAVDSPCPPARMGQTRVTVVDCHTTQIGNWVNQSRRARARRARRRRTNNYNNKVS